MKYSINILIIFLSVFSCGYAELFEDGPCATHHFDSPTDELYTVTLTGMNLFKVIYDGDDWPGGRGELISIKVELFRIGDRDGEYECEIASYWPSLQDPNVEYIFAEGLFSGSPFELPIEAESIVRVDQWDSGNEMLILRIRVRPEDEIGIRITYMEEDPGSNDINRYHMKMKLPERLPSQFSIECERHLISTLEPLGNGFMSFRNFRERESAEIQQIDDRGAFLEPLNGEICIRRWPEGAEVE